MSQSLSPVPTFVHALRLLRRHWIVLLTLPFVAVLGACLLFIVAAWKGFLLTAVTGTFLVTAYTLLTSYVLAQRSMLTIVESLRGLAQRLGTMLLFAVLLSLLPAALSSRPEWTLPALGLLSPIISVAVWYLEIRLMILPSVIAVEDASIVESVRRAWNLTASNQVGVIVVTLLMGPILMVAVTALSILLATLLYHGTTQGEGQVFLGLLGILLGVVLACALYLPFAVAVQAAVYLRLTSGEAPADAGMESSASVG